ncbi:MAG: oxygen-independent coproporphyrinogen III oxidase [Pseudomonadota bacterium]
MATFSRPENIRAEPLADRVIDRLSAKYSTNWAINNYYPSATQFRDDVEWNDYLDSQAGQDDRETPLSLYVQIPFCSEACHFCACDRVVTRERGVTRRYLQALAKEIELKANLVGKSRPVRSLHWGGGTPTYLDSAEMTELMYLVSRYFRLLSPRLEQHSIELDPRSLSSATVALLRGVGFKQIRLGVQDFNPRVQQAIHRTQSFASIAMHVDAIRDQGFEHLTFDMMYGLPEQDVDSMTDTLDKVVSLAPDGVAYHPYRHMPEQFSSQRNIHGHRVPGAATTLKLQLLIGQTLQASGYRLVGMDHFVLPTDGSPAAQFERSVAQKSPPYAGLMTQDEIGLGLAAISRLGDYHFQNPTDLQDYYEQIENKQLPDFRGHKASDEDKLRRHIISQLLSDMRLDLEKCNELFGIHFQAAFKSEMAKLHALEADGLITMDPHHILVTDHGRPFLATICGTFDAYRPSSSSGYS